MQFFTDATGDAKSRGGGGRRKSATYRPRRQSATLNDDDLLKEAQKDTGDYDDNHDVPISGDDTDDTSSLNLNLSDTTFDNGSDTSQMDIDDDDSNCGQNQPTPEDAQNDIHRRTTQQGDVWRCPRMLNIGGTKCW